MKYLKPEPFNVFMGGDKKTKCERCVHYGKQLICNNCRGWNKFCEPCNTKLMQLKKKIDNWLIKTFIGEK